MRCRQPLPGPAGGPGRPPRPGPGGLDQSGGLRRTCPGSRPSSSSPSRWTKFRTAGSRWWRTSTGPCAAPRATGSGAPCAGPIPPCGPNGRRLDWPRTPPPRTGPLWPPWPGNTAGVTGRPPANACNAALAIQRQAALDSQALRPAAARRPGLPGRSPRPLTRNRHQSPGDRSRPLPGATTRRPEPNQPPGSWTTTSTRRLAAESPGPTGSLAPCPTMISDDAGTPRASKKSATAVARSKDSR